MGVGPYSICEDCGSPLDDRQRYCLACGARVGGRSPELIALLGRQRATQGVETPAMGAESATPADGAGARASGLTLPEPRVSALLVLVFLGFGVLIGGAASPRVADTLASARSP